MSFKDLKLQPLYKRCLSSPSSQTSSQQNLSIIFTLYSYRSLLQRTMPDKSGLIFCGQQFGSNPFCVTKLVELLVSLLILIVIVHDMVIRYRCEPEIFNLFFGLCGLMILALLSNIGYCLDHRIYAFNCLQGFFFNFYFVTIVYYVAYKLFLVMQTKRLYIWILHCLFGISVIFLISVLIEKIINTRNTCEQLWYLVVSGFCIVLSIILTVLGAGYTRRQIQKLEGIENPINYKNPLPNIWIWISMNIFSQLCSLIESMIFEFTPARKCTFSDNFGVDQSIKLLFVFLSFHLGMVSTLIFFRNKYKRERENLSYGGSHTRRASVNIELIEEYTGASS